MRVRIIKNTTKYRTGEVVKVAIDEAMKLISNGIAIKSKDMVDIDVSTK